MVEYQELSINQKINHQIKLMASLLGIVVEDPVNMQQPLDHDRIAITAQFVVASRRVRQTALRYTSPR
jgi:hypothetical protein